MLQAWPEYGWLTLVKPSHCHHPKPWTTARPGPRETGRTGTCGVWTTSLRSLETCCRTPPLPHPDGCTEHAWGRRITCRDTLMEGDTHQDISSEMSVLLCCQRDKEPSGKTPAYFVDKLVFFFFAHVVLQIHRSSSRVKTHWYWTQTDSRSNKWEETIILRTAMIILLRIYAKFTSLFFFLPTNMITLSNWNVLFVLFFLVHFSLGFHGYVNSAYLIFFIISVV